MYPSARFRYLFTVLISLLLIGFSVPILSAQEASSPAASTQAMVAKYCVTCHNARLKTAGLVLEPGELTHVGSNPEQWEKVVRKLRTGAMPPTGAPRPD